MKIYHVKTQEAYDELMRELESEGIRWNDKVKATKNDIWYQNTNKTCISVYGNEFLGFSNIRYYKVTHPNVPIKEYTAKDNFTTDDSFSLKNMTKQSNYKTDEYYCMPKEEVVKRLNIKTEKAIDDAEMYRSIINKLEQIYLAKNNDYGNSFEESLNEFGEIVGVVRIGEKYNRIKSLFKTQEINVKDESKIDTLFDMANYCIMQAMWLMKGWGGNE